MKGVTGLLTDFAAFLGVRVRTGNQINVITGFSSLELAARFEPGPKKADRGGSLFPVVSKVQSENTVELVGKEGRGDLETRDESKVGKEQDHQIWRSGTLRAPLA